MGGLFGQMHERAAIAATWRSGRPDADAIFGIWHATRQLVLRAADPVSQPGAQGQLSNYDLSALRHCTSAGEPLNPEVIRAWPDDTRRPDRLRRLRADGDHVPGRRTSARSRYAPGRWAIPVPGYDVTVVDDDGHPIARGEVGNIVVRCQPDRQWDCSRVLTETPTRSAQAFRGPFTSPEIRRRLDGEGYFWFEGRDDDVITSSAYRIGPFEVESVLVEHPAVMEAAVVGRTTPDRTQIVVSVLLPRSRTRGSPELAKELQDFVKHGTAPYKYPREIYFVDELPKTISGKIRRSELRDQLHSGSFG